MLVLPTSLSSALVFEQSQGSPLWAMFGYVVVCLLFACGYCAWEMVLASMLGRRVPRSRWVAFVAAAGLFASGELVDAYVTVAVTFNDKLETTWGFVLSPWFFVAFIPVAAVLVIMRLADSLRAGRFARIPVIVWWMAGLAVTSGYGAWALWSGGRDATLEAATSAAGAVLAVASVLLLVAAGIKHRTRRAGTA